MEKRTVKITVRYTEEEHEKAKNLASYSLASYLRDLSLQQTKQTKTALVEKVADPKLIRQLSMIGNNLNQLARVANSEQSSLVSQKILLELSAIREQLERIENAN